MAEKNKLLFSKSEIAAKLGTNQRELDRWLPESVKKSVNWKPGKCLFRDIQAAEVLKYFRGLLTEAEIRAILYEN